MFRYKIILFLIWCFTIGVSQTKAQVVWSSPDGYSHVIEICYRSDATSAFQASDNRQQLQFIGSQIEQNIDKIRNKDYSIWVESYVKSDNLSADECRSRARVFSNTLKSYLISSCGVKESDFTTRNYCGTYDGRQGLTIVVIGMRYPWERILPLQLVDLTGVSDAPIGSPVVLQLPSDSGSLERPSGVVPNVDTAKILEPHFKAQTWTVDPPTSDKSNVVPRSSDRLPYSGGSKIDSVIVDLYSVRTISSFNTGHANDVETQSTLAAKQSVLGLSSNRNFSTIMAPPKSINALSSGSMVGVPATEQKRSQKVETSTSNERADQGGAVSVSTSTVVAPKSWQAGQSVKAGEVTSSAINTKKTRNELVPPPLTNGASIPQSKSSLTINTDQLEQKFNANAASAGFDATSKSKKSPKPEKIKTIKTRSNKSIGIPTVEVGSDGSIKLNAQAFEQSLNRETYNRQEEEIKHQQISEKKAQKTLALHTILERQRASRDAKGRFPLVGFGINALTALTATPSAQLDFYIHNRFSLSVEGAYSNWSLLGDDYRTKVWAVSPEFRVWTCKAKKFTGVYVGVYGSMGDYNFRWDSRHGEQADFWSVGLSVGYVMQFGKSNFFMDAGISGGYIMRDVDKYLYHQGLNYSEGSFTKASFFPTKAKVTFFYRFFNKKRSE